MTILKTVLLISALSQKTSPLVLVANAVAMIIIRNQVLTQHHLCQRPANNSSVAKDLFGHTNRSILSAVVGDAHVAAVSPELTIGSLIYLVVEDNEIPDLLEFGLDWQLIHQLRHRYRREEILDESADPT